VVGGAYTYEWRDWNAVNDIVEMTRDQQIPDGYPHIDIDHAMELLVYGAPLELSLACTFQELAEREAYDNHPPLADALEEVLTMFQKEEQLAYHLLFPRFIWQFLYGLFISPINWVTAPGKEGRFCLDPTTNISKSPHRFGQNLQPRPPPGNAHFIPKKYKHCPDGSPNSQIPDTGVDGAEWSNPKVYYATAFKRFLVWLWRLRLDLPREEILMLADDISGAFRRVLYNPRIALGFGSVFKNYLVIPTALIFGAKNSPSLYMVAAEVRAHIAAVLGSLDRFTSKLAKNLVFPPTLSDTEASLLVPAVPDSNHGTLALAGGDRQPSFVDDTGNAGTHRTIRTTVNRSVIGAYIMFGFPEESKYRPPVINPTKWECLLSHILTYLGMLINSRQMSVTWPLEKRQKLASMLDDAWLHSPNPVLAPRLISKLLGLIRNGALVSVFGTAFSLQLQYRLSDALRKNLKVSYVKGKPMKPGKRWWKLGRVPIPTDVIAELTILRPTLLDKKFNHLWTRPISHLVPRDATLESEGDAAYGGMGGLSPQVSMMWRLSRQDLVDVGFPMFKGEPVPGAIEKGTHINILEFIALIIGIWITLSLAGPGSNDIIYIPWSDNTSALAWLGHSARATNPVVRRYARFLQSMIAHCPYSFSLQGRHIKGKDNEDADLASRPERAPTWRSVIAQVSSPAQSCHPYQVPYELLTALRRLRTVEETGDWYATKTTALWTIVPKTLQDGWIDCISTVERYPLSKKST
jgi:hypothetical protein